jgi:hypothetical protein
MARAAGTIFLIAAVGLGLLSLSAEPSDLGLSPWKGYRVLLVDAAVPEAEVLSSLRGVGIGKVISESTEPVLISDWAHPQTMSLAAARASLVPGDPRLDAYLQRLGRWFEARSSGAAYRAYYIATESFAFVETGLDRKVSEALLGFKGRFVLADAGSPVPSKREGALRFVAALALLLVASVIGPLMGKNSLSIRTIFARKPGGMTLDLIAFRLSLMLPWAVLSSGAPSTAALAVLWAFAFAELADMLDIPLDEFRSGEGLRTAMESLRHQGFPPLALPATALLALILSPESILSVAMACLGSIAAAVGYALASGGLFARKRFIPMPIGLFFRRRGLSTAGKARGFLVCAVIVLWGLDRFLSPSTLPLATIGIEYPTPVVASGNAQPLIAEARARGSAETGSILPGISSYLEHRAFQESLPFIPVGESRADPFAPASLPLPGGSSQILTFDDKWAREVYASLPPLSVEGMLLAQGPATVGRSSGGLAGAVRSSRPLALIECLLYIFLLVPPLARLFRGIPLAKGPLSGELRQEA